MSRRLRANEKTVVAQYQDLLNLNPGARFRAVDLHVHTPASQDYRIDGISYSEATLAHVLNVASSVGMVAQDFAQVQAAIEFDKDEVVAELIVHCAMGNNVELLAVCDHNTMGWFERIRAAYSRYKSRIAGERWLVVLPACEITAFGGTHIVGVFDAPKPSESIDELWTGLSQDCGLPNNARGRTEVPATKAEIEVARAIEQHGGIAYIPHFDTIDRRRVGGATRKLLLAEKALAGVGLTQRDKNSAFVLKEVRKSGRRKAFAVFRDSDAHDPMQAGAKALWVKMDEVGFPALKLAATEHPEWRISSTVPKEKSTRILGLASYGGWFRPQTGGWEQCRFSDDLTALVGGRGTGKSTLVNFIQSAVTGRVASREQLGFLASFDHVLVFAEVEGVPYCISIQPNASVDSYGILQVNGTAWSALDEEVGGCDIRDWVRVRRLARNRAWRASSAEFQRVMRVLGAELYGQTRIEGVVKHELSFDSFFTDVLGSHSNDAYELLLERESLTDRLTILADQVPSTAAADELRSIRIRLSAIRESLQPIRAQTVSAINERLRSVVRLDIRPSDAAARHLDRLHLLAQRRWELNGEERRVSEELFTRLTQAYSPLHLVELLIRGSTNEIAVGADAASIEPPLLSRGGVVNPAQMIDLLVRDIAVLAPELVRITDDERVALRFDVSPPGSRLSALWRDLPELSLGQRTVALLTLVTEGLAETGAGPLIIDQPEDHLDNSSVWVSLVGALRHAKGRRQVILSTHNANIVIGGDAEQVLYLESDGSHGWVRERGSVDRRAILRVLVRTLEGGHDALWARLRKYQMYGRGLDPDELE
jgi:hypothetical protein